MDFKSSSETAHPEMGKAEPAADHASTSEDAARPSEYASSAATEHPGGIFAEPPSASDKRDGLRGGIFSPSEALKLLNSHYLIGK